MEELEEPALAEKENPELELKGWETIVADPNGEAPKPDEELPSPNVGEADELSWLTELSDNCWIPVPDLDD